MEESPDVWGEYFKLGDNKNKMKIFSSLSNKTLGFILLKKVC